MVRGCVVVVIVVMGEVATKLIEWLTMDEWCCVLVWSVSMK